MTPISVLIADDIATTREDIKRLLYFEEDIKVVGEAADGEEVISSAEELQPDVILMDINMPRLDGIGATEQISMNVPHCAIIIISIQGEQEYLRKAMAAGAREYLVKPFSGNDLANSIRRVYEGQKRRNARLFTSYPAINSTSLRRKKGKVIAFFCTKGGVGKTTLACNLAVTLAQDLKKRVVLADLDLSSGDAAVMLNITVKSTIADLVQEQEVPDFQLADAFLIPHISGAKLLPAPMSPEQAELVRVSHIEQLLKILKDNFDYIILDTAPFYSDINLAALEASDKIFLILNQELTTLKHIKTAQDILTALNHGDKVRVILNQNNNEGIKVKELEKSLGISISAAIPEDQKTVKGSINKGIPFVMGQPHAKISSCISNLLNALDMGSVNDPSEPERKRSAVSRLFRR